MTDNVSDTLNKAADLIEERGWAQGSDSWGYVDPTGPVCLEGAIAAAMGRVANAGGPDGMWPEDINTCAAGRAVRSYLEWTDPQLWVCGWNDAKNRTAAEVIEVLRAAALIESARERETAEQVTE